MHESCQSIVNETRFHWNLDWRSFNGQAQGKSPEELPYLNLGLGSTLVETCADASAPSLIPQRHRSGNCPWKGALATGPRRQGYHMAPDLHGAVQEYL
jgi:hypothetical protein